MSDDPTTRDTDEQSEAATSVPTVIVAGQLIDGRYRLKRLLARGGMSEVWVAKHEHLGRTVALKFVRADSAVMRALLLEEGKILASLRHPSVVEVHDCGMLAGKLPFLVMELVEGETLREELARVGRMSARTAVETLLPVVAGVAAIHARGIVHRDIKPDNILRTHGPARAIKLIDFGISQRTDSPQAGPLFSGTPSYMAPEQVRGEQVDHRVDLWALGATLYEFMVGRPPFELDGQVATTMALALEGHVAFPRDVHGLDGGLWRVLMGCLRTDPGQRVATALALYEALESWLSKQVERQSAPTLQGEGLRRSQPALDTTVTAQPDSGAELSSLDALIRDRLTNS
ncbi:MAG: serine/threonine-protein kinase [Deltaproteobacteria bacterium]|nr:serine/threonine-protein kinase [Deltaproteobacteria bacterium]